MWLCLGLLSTALSCNLTCVLCNGPTASECTYCVVNASEAPPETCVCNPAFYPNPDTSVCSPCHISCSTCNGPADINCQSCASASHYPNPNTAPCAPCDSTCLSCTAGGPSDCTGCYANAHSASGVCVCDSAFYPDTDASKCSSCHISCSTCNGPADINCQSCASASHYPNPNTAPCAPCDPTCLSCTAGGPNYCKECYTNAYLSTGQEISLCRPCHRSCQTCTGPNPNQCTSCQAGEERIKQAGVDSQGFCVCLDGSVPNPVPGKCIICDSSCLTCAGPAANQCTNCSPGRKAQGSAASQGFCVCPDGSLPNPIPGQCLQCHFSCLTCSDSVKCASCISGLYLTLKGECVVCPSCAQPFTASVTSPYDHTYLISFNHNCIYPFTAEDFAFSTEPVSNLTWAVEAASPLVVSVHGGPWYIHTTFRLSFPHPDYILDIFGSVLTVSSLEIPSPSGAIFLTPNSTAPNSNTTLSTSSDSTSDSTLTAQEQSVATASQKSWNAVAAGALAARALVDSSAAMTLVIQIQYFSFIGSAGVSLPGGMGGMYAGMNQKSLLPNFFSRTRTGSGRRLDTSDVFDFLEEAGSFLSLFVLLFGLHLLIRLISLPCKGKLPRVLTWALQNCEWSLYLDFLGFTYLDLTLNALSQIHKADRSSDLRTVLNLSLSAAVLGLMVVFPPYTFYLLRKHRQRLFVAETLPAAQVSGVMKRWAKLVSGIREDVVWAQYFQPASYIQRFAYASILVLLPPGKWLCLGLVFPSLWITAFVVAFRPDDSAVQRFLHIGTEVQTLLLFASIFLIKVIADGSLALGWAIVTLSLGALACGVVSFLLDIREKIATFSHKVCCKKQNAAIKAEAYDVNTSAFENQNSSILSTGSLYPSQQEGRLRGTLAALAWAPVGKPKRQLSDQNQKFPVK